MSWHLLEDVAGWGAILIGSVIIRFWDNHLIDPIMTVGYTVFILGGSEESQGDLEHPAARGAGAHRARPDQEPPSHLAGEVKACTTFTSGPLNERPTYSPEMSWWKTNSHEAPHRSYP